MSYYPSSQTTPTYAPTAPLLVLPFENKDRASAAHSRISLCCGSSSEGFRVKALIGEQIMESIKEKKCSCTRIHTYKIQKSACREVEKKSL